MKIPLKFFDPHSPLEMYDCPHFKDWNAVELGNLNPCGTLKLCVLSHLIFMTIL